MSETFFHGSYKKLKIGTVLSGRGKEYIEKWFVYPEYIVLENERPSRCIPHYEAVFMVDNVEDIDNAGGGTNYIFTLLPIGKIEKHDMAWQSEILMAIDDKEHPDKIKSMAKKYWSGVATKSPVWEYLTRKAKIIKVEKF